MPIPPLNQLSKGKRAWRDRQKNYYLTRGSWFRRNRKILFLIFVILFLLFGIFTVGAFAWIGRDLPSPDKLIDRSLAESTKIYDRTGQTLLYDIHGAEKRTIINLEDIPESLKWATIVAEDRDFYKHHGFDLRGIIRAAFNIVLRGGKKVQGGSTITQQFIKNAILTSEKTYTRKIKELVLAYQLESKFSKDQILKLYFNEIPYGSSAYGAESASQTYFGKSAKELTIAQSALLAALPRAPTYYSPWGSHPDELYGRQHYILDEMAKGGYITQDEATQAKKEELGLKQKRESILAPHFVFYIKEYLTEKYGEKMTEQGGLKVITTLDLYKQKAAEEAIDKGISKVEKYKGSNAAMVALDPKNGQILAMVGSRDYFDLAHDGNVNVTIRPRQPGSSFKPVVYAAAFKKGYTPQTILFDLVTNFKTDNKDYTPHNYDSKEHGPLTMRQALAGSLNIPAVKTLYLTGLDKVLDLADQMGYTTLKDRSRFGLSLVLGGGEVKLIEHTNAFAVFSREGLYHPLAPVLKIEDRGGKTLEQFTEREEKVLEKEVAQRINSILADDSARAFIFGAGGPLTLSDRPAAAKTGTTNDYRDAWTIGYTPSLATGVWVGNNDNAEMKRGADGVVVAAPIWHDFMDRVLKGTPVETFRPPAEEKEKPDKPVLNGQFISTEKIMVDKYTKKMVPASCTDYPKEYLEEKEVKEVHTILYYLNKDDPRGPAPADPTADPQFANWEAKVQQWAYGQGYFTPHWPEESCSLRAETNRPKVVINTPAENQTVNQSSLEITATASGPNLVKRVEFYFGDQLIASLNQAPYATTYSLPQLVNGFYQITVKAYDSLENVGQSSVTINLLSNQAPINSNQNVNQTP